MNKFTSISSRGKAACFLAALATFFLGVFLAPTKPKKVDAQTLNCTPMANRRLSWANNSIVYIDRSSISSSTIRQQIDVATVGNWSQALAQVGLNISFTTNSAYVDSPTRLTFRIGTNPPDANGVVGAAAVINPVIDANGNLTSATIQFDLSVQGTNQQGQAAPMLSESNPNSFLKASEHETGHTLGLGENVADPNQACGGQIAGSSVMNGMCGAGDWTGNMSQSVTLCDMDRVTALPQYAGQAQPTPTPTPDNSNCTLSELGSPGDYGCYHCYDSWDSDCDNAYDFGDDECSAQCFASPVLVDLNGDGFNLTAPTHSFDMTGLGRPQTVSAAQGDDAWLVLDRDGDNRITSGRELFGNYTPQLYRATPNGFNALAVFDRHKSGGNEDAVIDNQDAVYSFLRLWKDVNSDWISTPDELFPLEKFGVTSIDLNYKESRRKDKYGNVFRYRAKVNDTKFAYDVFLTSK